MSPGLLRSASAGRLGLAVALGLFGAQGCQNRIGANRAQGTQVFNQTEPPAPSPYSGSKTVADPKPERHTLCRDPRKVSSSGARRLNQVAYLNTLATLFGDEAMKSTDVRDALRGLVEEGLGHDFKTKDRPPSFQDIQGYAQIALSLAEYATQDSRRLAKLEPCLGEKSEPSLDGCIDQFIRTFGGRVLRRPLQSEEEEDLRALYRETASVSHQEGVEAVIQVLIQGPSFLYALENQGEPDIEHPGELTLTPYELASRLSYAMWQDMPDQELFDAAYAGTLKSKPEYERQVRRMLSDKRTERSIHRFFEEWLGLDELPAFNYSDAFLADQDIEGLRAPIVREALDFAVSLVWNSGGSFRDLMTSSRAVIDSDAVAKIYNIDPELMGPEIQLPETRSGILTRAAVLISGRDSVSPIIRGTQVRREFLCDDPPPPPPDLDINTSLDAVSWTQNTTRSYFDQVTAVSPCASCHALINPAGHALGAFDGLGRFSPTEKRYHEDGQVKQEYPVDTQVELTVRSDTTRVKDAVELSTLIGESEQAKECFSKKIFEYTLGKVPALEDGCHLEDMVQALHGEEAPLREVLVQLVSSPQFLRKKVDR